MFDGRLGVSHLFDDVVDDCLLDQNDRPTFDSTFEASARPKIDQQIRFKAIGHILGRRGCGDLSPAPMKDRYASMIKSCFKKLVERRLLNVGIRKEGPDRAPFAVRRNEY